MDLAALQVLGVCGTVPTGQGQDSGKLDAGRGEGVRLRCPDLARWPELFTGHLCPWGTVGSPALPQEEGVPGPYGHPDDDSAPACAWLRDNSEGWCPSNPPAQRSIQRKSVRVPLQPRLVTLRTLHSCRKPKALPMKSAWSFLSPAGEERGAPGQRLPDCRVQGSPPGP